MIRTPSVRHRADELFMRPPRSINDHWVCVGCNPVKISVKSASMETLADSTVIGPQISEIFQVTPHH
jgi:hypothetical protein